MIFERPSTRTRVSFEVAMRQLGGDAILLTAEEMQLGRGETLADTARVLSRYIDAIMIRTLDPAAVAELARYATVPVINGLTRRSHPCQVMADVMTFEEHRGPIRGRTVAWTGDANNVLTSWMHAAERFEFPLRVASPPELAPKKPLLDWIKSSGAAISIGTDPDEAVKGADCVVTDTWVSMGDRNGARRHNLLKRYQVNARLMARAKPDAIFMHCLPAHRGEEVTDEVMDGPQSVVFDEAENRLHAQKGILAWCLEANGSCRVGRGLTIAPPSPIFSAMNNPDFAIPVRAPAQTGLDDTILPFAVKALDLRGRIVRLGPAVDAILGSHDYPPPVAKLLGEAIVLTVMLGSSLKFEGRFILQTQSDGPVRMLVVDFTSPGKVRACARFDAARVDQAIADGAARRANCSVTAISP